jgi:hypothetical protein
MAGGKRHQTHSKEKNTWIQGAQSLQLIGQQLKSMCFFFKEINTIFMNKQVN